MPVSSQARIIHIPGICIHMPGILIHIAPESLFTCPGIRIFVRDGKSAAARRTIPLSERGAEALKALLNASKCDFVYTTDCGLHGATRHYVSEQFREIRDALKLPWDCFLHSCRHTFLTRLGESGVDVFTLKRLAGHTNIAVSEKYVHHAAAEDAIDKVEEVRDKQQRRKQKIIVSVRRLEERVE
jgi:integrase